MTASSDTRRDEGKATPKVAREQSAQRHRDETPAQCQWSRQGKNGPHPESIEDVTRKPTLVERTRPIDPVGARTTQAEHQARMKTQEHAPLKRPDGGRTQTDRPVLIEYCAQIVREDFNHGIAATIVALAGDTVAADEQIAPHGERRPQEEVHVQQVTADKLPGIEPPQYRLVDEAGGNEGHQLTGSCHELTRIGKGFFIATVARVFGKPVVIVAIGPHADDAKTGLRSTLQEQREHAIEQHVVIAEHEDVLAARLVEALREIAIGTDILGIAKITNAQSGCLRALDDRRGRVAAGIVRHQYFDAARGELRTLGLKTGQTGGEKGMSIPGRNRDSDSRSVHAQSATQGRLRR